MLIVCPFNRPAQIDGVLESWKRQRAVCELVLVANSVGNWCDAARRAGAHVIVVPASIGQAKNFGVSFARGSNHESIVFWDDDNYYGPSHVLQMQEQLERADVVSQGIAFVRFDDGLYLFKTPLGFCPGHSTAVRLDACPEFPDWSLREDVEWSRRLRAGVRISHAPPWYLIYDRRSGEHAYNAGKAEFMRSFGPAFRIGNVRNSFVDEASDLSNHELANSNDEEIFQMMEGILASQGFR